MSRTNSLLIVLLLSPFFLGCKKQVLQSKPEYSSNFNQVIKQLTIDEACGCISELPEVSFLESRRIESPNLDIGKVLIKKLNLRDRKELDSLDKIAKRFVMDAAYMKSNHIKIISHKEIQALAIGNEIFKICPEGVLYFQRPIFNKNYDRALVDFGYAYIGSPPFSIYKFQNGKWHR